VPAAVSPYRRAASVLLVAVKPAMADARATASPASMPWVRRKEKSTSWAPPAASAHRAALLAMGAVTSTSGSPANTAVPSGTAQTSPVNRNRRNASKSGSVNPWDSASQAMSAAVNANCSRNARQSSRPAAIRNPRSAGSRRTNRLNVAGPVIPRRR